MEDSLLLHERGECKPCAYFHGKEDGGRHGANCSFCHLCPPRAINMRKKEKLRRMKNEKQCEKPSVKHAQAQAKPKPERGFKSDQCPASQKPLRGTAMRLFMELQMEANRGKSDDETTQEPSADEHLPKIESPPGLCRESLGEILQIHGLPACGGSPHAPF
eukprot:TRINITY_DN24924_c0_g1_i1.p1 TRINITY_DN24924_c0_g1~~TRINITY_DN24924_c0_g1_i1.p1  ORF type:complete len:161 (+),score=26.87 TRINITY_DN24924_c0_g1_i1:65-547(+)